MGWADSIEENTLKHNFTITTYNPPDPGTFHIGLATDTTGMATGSASTELSGNGYARVTGVTWAWDAANKWVENSSEITFPSPTGAWNDIGVIFIALTLSGSDVIYYGATTTLSGVASGDTVKILAGNLRVQVG